MSTSCNRTDSTSGGLYGLKINPYNYVILSQRGCGGPFISFLRTRVLWKNRAARFLSRKTRRYLLYAVSVAVKRFGASSSRDRKDIYQVESPGHPLRSSQQGRERFTNANRGNPSLFLRFSFTGVRLLYIAYPQSRVPFYFRIPLLSLSLFFLRFISFSIPSRCLHRAEGPVQGKLHR